MAGVWTTGGFAEMRTTTERTAFVNLAQPRFPEKRTRAIGGRNNLLSPGGSPGSGGDQRFTLGQERRASVEPETTALGNAGAIPRNRPAGQFGVNFPHLPDRLVVHVRNRISSLKTEN